MGLASSLRIIGSGVAWRTFGTASSGDRLLDTIAGDDEQLGMLAGISLVRAGERSMELIAQRVSSGTVSPQAIRLLPDIGGERARAILQEAHNLEGDVGIAAGEALELLDRIQALDDD